MYLAVLVWKLIQPNRSYYWIAWIISQKYQNIPAFQKKGLFSCIYFETNTAINHRKTDKDTLRKYSREMSSNKPSNWIKFIPIYSNDDSTIEIEILHLQPTSLPLDINSGDNLVNHIPQIKETSIKIQTLFITWKTKKNIIMRIQLGKHINDTLTTGTQPWQYQ